MKELAALESQNIAGFKSLGVGGLSNNKSEYMVETTQSVM